MGTGRGVGSPLQALRIRRLIKPLVLTSHFRSASIYVVSSASFAIVPADHHIKIAGLAWTITPTDLD